MRNLLLFMSCSVLAMAGVKDAQRLYNQKNYTGAIAQAKKSTHEYANPKLHLVWARSAKALGQNLEAMSAYERVVMLDAKNIEAKKELARTYVALGKEKLAIQITQELKEENVEFEEIKIVNEKEVGDNFKSKFSLAFGYDSNVNVHNESNDLDTFFGSTAHTNKISSTFLLGTANVDYLKEFENSIYLRASLDGYYKIANKESDYSIYLNTFKAGVGYYKSGQYNFYMPLSYSALHYLGEDLLRIQSLDPQIDYMIDENLIASINGKFEKREFRTDRNRDDKSFALGGTLYYKVDKNYLFLDTEYQNYTSDSNNYQDFTDKTTYTFVLGGRYSFGDELEASATYKLRLSDFEDDIGTIFVPSTQVREDTYHQINLKLTKTINKSMSVFVENEYALNDSNYIPADYSKNSLMIGINFSY
ncbi:MAG: hypothetical protein JXQ76_00650 [Campylobacterales bacterium]|nr:hypothetical protein [Campylobacterales bacterium]